MNQGNSHEVLNELNTTSENGAMFLTDWFCRNSNKINAEAGICVGVILMINALDLNQFLDKKIQFILNVNVCWAEFISFHTILFFFSAIYFARVIKESNILKIRTSEYKYLINYINQETEENDVFSSNKSKQKLRKAKLVFSLTILCVLVPITVYDWIRFLGNCNMESNSPHMSLLGVILYAFLIIRLPFYVIGLLQYFRNPNCKY